jgi:hypothetical protein
MADVHSGKRPKASAIAPAAASLKYSDSVDRTNHRRGALHRQYVDRPGAAQQRLRADQPHGREFRVIDAQDTRQNVMQVHDAPSHFTADGFFARGPARDLRAIRPQQPGCGIRSQRIHHPGQERRYIRKRLGSRPENDGTRPHRPSPRFAIQLSHASVVSQHYLLSKVPGQRTTGHPVSVSIASNRLYLAKRSDCVMDPGLN